MNKTDVLIIGAGPTGLFCAHQLGIIGLSCEIVDNLDKAGGQCIELYPDKPIYDIPAIPECTGEELTNNLLKQIKPFNVKFHLNERVEELKKNQNRWHVKTSGGTEFDVAAIVIAGGVGSFEPRKFPVKESVKYEGSSLFYSIKDKSIFKDKIISIFGGGDSALDWAIELSNTSIVNLIHRRDGFSGAEANVQKIKHDEGEIKEIKSNYVLGFFGLIMQLGPILDWGLNIDKKTVQVNTENFETNINGIFAIGDICSYPGKLKLILSGFHEGALAARGCFKYAKPDEKLRFEFTTTSKAAQERLGIKK